MLYQVKYNIFYIKNLKNGFAYIWVLYQIRMILPTLDKTSDII